MKKLYIAAGIVIGLILAMAGVARGATVLFPSGGGTGTSTSPAYGQVLVGNAGGTYTLTATSSLGIISGVSSFNTRTGAITLNSGDVTSALGYTPSNFAYPFPSNATSTALTFNAPFTVLNPSTTQGDGAYLGTDSSHGIKFGYYNANNYALWAGGVVPGATNYGFLLANNGTSAQFNSTNNVEFNISDATKLAINSSGGVTLASLTNGLVKSASGLLSNAANGTDYTLVTANTCSAGQHVSSITAAGVTTCTPDSGGGGGSGVGTIATSSTEAPNEVPFFTSTAAYPALLSGSSTLNYNNTNGHFGVGSTSPSQTLVVSGNGYIGQDGLATGSLGTVFSTFTSDLTSNVIINSFQAVGTAPSSGNVQALQFNVTDTGTNNVSSLTGLNGLATKSGSGSIATLTGVQASARISGTVTATAIIGFNSALRVQAGTSATNVTDFNAAGTSVGGTITNAYGIRIAAKKIANVTTGYGVAQDGTSDLNYFLGNTGFGSSTPTYIFSVNTGATGASIDSSGNFRLNALASGLVKSTSGLIGSAANGTDYTLVTANTCGAGQFFNSATAAGIFGCGTPLSGSTGLATSSPVAAGNILAYSATGAGSAYGVATSSPTNGTGISLSGTGSVVNGSLSITNTSPLSALVAGFPFSFTGSNTLGWLGLSTSSPIVSGQPIYATGPNTIASVASSTYLASLGGQVSGNYITALTGDITASGPGSVAATLATVNSNVGTFTYPSVTVNGKGLITAISNGTAPSIYSATYPVTLTGSAFGLAFGTTTSNTWGGIQTFTNSPVFSTLTAGTVNSTAGGALYSTATSSLTNGTGIGFTGTAGALVGGSSLSITNTGLLSLQQLGGGTAQIGAITLATSTLSLNGQVHGIAITNTAGAFSFIPTLSGVLTVAGGGTGISTVADGALLFGGAGGGAANLTALATSTGGTILQTSFTTGRPTWVATSTLGISAAPGGATTQVQFNDGGVFNGDSNFIWNKTLHALGIGSTTPWAQFALGNSGFSSPFGISSSTSQYANVLFQNIFSTGTASATTTVSYIAAGSNNFTVPAGVTLVCFKMWGAGGGSLAGSFNSGGGGGGGFTGGCIPVSGGQVLTSVVGSGGGSSQQNGGGLTDINISGTNVAVSGSGGGGGAGNSSDSSGGSGGAAGGSTGSDGGFSGTACTTPGKGATISAVGAGSTGCASNGVAGSGNTGGNGGTASGQGGAGWKGGGGGGQNPTGFNEGGGGGGGSSYFGVSPMPTATSTTAASGSTAGNNLDPVYANSAGQGGGSSSSGGTGNPGQIVLTYAIPAAKYQSTFFGVGTTSPSALFSGETGEGNNIFMISDFFANVKYLVYQMDQWGDEIFSGLPPIANSCTGFAVSGAANNHTGTITYTTAPTCSITFGKAYPTGVTVSCYVTPETSNSTVSITAISTTGFTASFGTSQAKFGYQCTAAR